MAQRDALFNENGADPFQVKMDEVLSQTEAVIEGRRTILVGTNNYLGLTFAPEALDAAHAALDAYGTGTTGSRVANGTYGGHKELEQALCDFYGMLQFMTVCAEARPKSFVSNTMMLPTWISVLPVWRVSRAIS